MPDILHGSIETHPNCDTIPLIAAANLVTRV